MKNMIHNNTINMKKLLSLCVALVVSICLWAAKSDVVTTNSAGVSVSFSSNNSYEWEWDSGSNRLRSTNYNINSSTSQTTITISCPSSCSFSFDYAVSSEPNYDKLTILLDNQTIVNGISGSISNTYNGTLAGGSHSLVLEYVKDESAKSGDDRAYLSNVQFVNTNIISGKCGTNLNWSLDRGTGELIISGTGYMTNASGWNQYKTEIQSLRIGAGVSSIGNEDLCREAFTGCTQLQSVIIEDSSSPLSVAWRYDDCTSCDDYSWVYIFGSTNIKTLYLGRSLSGSTEEVSPFVRNLTSLQIGQYVATIPSLAEASQLSSITINGNNQNFVLENRALYNKTKTRLLRILPTAYGATIPSTVTNIDYGAASYCTHLSSVSLAGCNVASIPGRMFCNCSGLTTVSLPNSLTTIEERAFNGCSGLKSVTIPTGVTSIGTSTFNGCSSLTSVSIPNSVTSIGSFAFGNCNALVSITIPSSVSSIYEGAFSNCQNLASITLKRFTPATLDEDDYEVWYNISASAVFKVPQGTIAAYQNAWGTSYNFEEGSCGKCGNNLYWDYDQQHYTLTITGSGAMDNYTYSSPAPWSSYYFSTITLPNGLTHIGAYAFYARCANSINIPSSVTSIGSSAFNSTLKSVYITNLNAWLGFNFQSISDNPLYDAHNLYLNDIKVSNLIIPEGITEIKNYAFVGASIKSVVFPQGLQSIGNYAFYDCNGLNPAIYLPDGLQSIGDWAFYSCDKLTFVQIPSTVNSIGSYAFGSGVRFIAYDGNAIGSPWGANHVCSAVNGKFLFDDTEMTNLICCLPDISGDVEIPNGVEIIGSSAFSECTNMTSVVIPNSVTNIEYRAFYKCTGLTSLTIPNSVTSIGTYAFEGCSGLENITFSTNTTNIGRGAFEYCSALTAVNYLGTLTDWCNITFGGEYVNGPYANPLLYAKNLYINGEKVEDLVIPDSVTQIKDHTFAGCNMSSVQIHNKVTSIGHHAFSECKQLTTLTLPSSVSSLGGEAFWACNHLTSITCEATTPPICTNYNTFQLVPENIPIYVPCGRVSAYESASQWSGFTNYIEKCSYSRHTTSGNYGTICLPKAVANEDIQGGVFFNILYAITNANDDITGVLIEEEEGDLVAGKAYIFRATADELTLLYTGDAVENPVATDGLVGNISETPLEVPQNMYVLSNNQIKKLTSSSATTGQNEAYIDLTSVAKLNYIPDAAPNRVMLDVVEEDPIATDLDDIKSEGVQKMVRNGQIFILRGDRVYTLQGQEAQ